MTWSYPPDTKAFLYYFTSPEKPRIAGELRLRVTSSDDPASFESGSDLLRANGQLWSRPLHSLPKYYPLLYEKLREELLVPDDLDTMLISTFSQKSTNSRSQLLYTLNDTFFIDFSTKDLFLFVVTEQGVGSLTFFRPFRDNRDRRNVSPYTGAYTNCLPSLLLY